MGTATKRTIAGWKGACTFKRKQLERSMKKLQCLEQYTEVVQSMIDSGVLFHHEQTNSYHMACIPMWRGMTPEEYVDDLTKHISYLKEDNQRLRLDINNLISKIMKGESK